MDKNLIIIPYTKIQGINVNILIIYINVNFLNLKIQNDAISVIYTFSKIRCNFIIIN